ncbi:UNVERIFIED_CONTAM: hypothetical protein FKN15_063678 [Acipenser sinensis]
MANIYKLYGDAPYCTPEQYKECADPALDFLVEKDNDYCVCETPCNMTRYNKELSFVRIPSKASARYLAKKYNKSEQYIAENILVLDIFFEALNYETIEQKKAYEVAGLLGKLGSRAMNKREITSDSESRGREGNVDKENILVLDIFFEALNYETIEQKKAYEVAGLLGDIGGQMGLFIGASLLTILELFDYLYEVVKHKMRRALCRKQHKRNNNNKGVVLSLDDVKRHVPCESLQAPSTYPPWQKHALCMNVIPEAELGSRLIYSERLDIQEALKRPIKTAISKYDATKQKRKFSSFFKSLVIELDKDLYGPDNHLVEWHRTATTQETDGFQVKRPGDVGVRCTVLLMLDYQPPQFKLDPRLARMLGIHTQTRPVIIQALWQYVKTHKLQDPHEREFINCDKYLQQIFETQRMKFSEIPQRLHALLMPPEPIIINHVISVDPNDQKKTACYDIDVEVDDTLKTQMNSFLLSTASQQEIAALDNKIHETIETINQLKTQREFMLSFARDPQGFINDWLQSQCRDLKTMTDVVGNPEEERRAEFYFQPWAQEAVCRYFYSKVQQRRQELEQALGIRNT